MTQEEYNVRLGGQIALLKFQCTRIAHSIADDTVQIFGGRAITKTGMGKVLPQHTYMPCTIIFYMFSTFNLHGLFVLAFCICCWAYFRRISSALSVPTNMQPSLEAPKKLWLTWASSRSTNLVQMSSGVVFSCLLLSCPVSSRFVLSSSFCLFLLVIICTVRLRRCVVTLAMLASKRRIDPSLPKVPTLQLDILPSL